MTKNTFLTILTISIISTILFALCTAFSFQLDPTKTGGYYQLLSDAFLQKKSALLIPPDPRLLALPDPYDPAQNAPYRIHDLSLFRNRYYLYWGPVPAIVRIIFGNKLPEQFFTYLYVTLSAICFFLIAKNLKTKYFLKLSNLFLYFAVLSGIFNGAVLNLLVSSGIYYEAIAAGQCFFIIGLLFTTSYLTTNRPKYAFISAIFYTLSVGSRVSYVIPSLGITLYIFIKLNRSLSFLPRLLFFAPLFIGLFLLGLYNFIRFDNFFEFGLRYQLAGLNMPLMYKNYLSLHNIPIGIKSYFLNLPSLIYHLPFITMDTKHYSNIERLVFSSFLISPATVFIFTHDSLKQITKLKYFFFIISALIVISITLPSPQAATRYFFDFIFVINLTGFLYLLSKVSSAPPSTKRSIPLILIPLSFICLFISISMYLRGLQEYHYQAYFNINRYLYQVFKQPFIIDKDCYMDLKTVDNTTGYQVINDRNDSPFGVSAIPKNNQKHLYTKIQSRPLKLRFTSFEPHPISLKLSFVAQSDPKIKSDLLKITFGQQIKQFSLNSIATISVPLRLKTGFNDIYIESENISKNLSSPPIELTNFQLTPSSDTP